MPIGRVKWYDKSKGYGFIENPKGDVFFHFSDILMDGFKALAEDQRVSYEIVQSSNGLKAKDIRPTDNRASVRHAARYRALLHMDIKQGQEASFDKFINDIPAWFDAMEQDLGLRRIGTWRNGLTAVHLVESDKPYDQANNVTEASPYYEEYVAWRDKLESFLVEPPSLMQPVDPDEEISHENATNEETQNIE